MHTGMLWFDNSKDSVLIKVQKAFNYYVKKYGRTPDLVLVHPSLLDESIVDGKVELTENKSIAVRPYRPVLPGHVWIGIEDTN